jgi:mannose-1-phosphate guanylyltransferase
VRAVVLVGGFGTRLRPLTHSTPKQMLPIVHVPMIERVVRGLVRFGIDDAVLSMGYRPDAFTEAYPDGRCAGVALHYAVAPEPLHPAGAIRSAAQDAAIDERFVVVNGDVLTDLDVDALVAFHDERGAEATIALHRVDDPSAFGVVPTDDDGRVLAFVEKPKRSEAPTDLINAGTYVLEPSVLDRIEAGRRVSIERETFPAIVAGGRLFAMASDAYWIDAGTPLQYLQAQLDLLDGTRGPAEDGCHADSVVDPGATLDRAVVGPGAVIEAGATVRRSVVMAGARVRAGASVEDSIVGPGADVGEEAALSQHTVIGDGRNVDPGAQLHGARLPEDEQA